MEKNIAPELCEDCSQNHEKPSVQTTRASHLITGSAARLQTLCVVSAAEEASLLEEVDHVDQQLPTHAAREAGGVPGDVRARPGRLHTHVRPRERLRTLPRRETEIPVSVRFINAVRGDWLFNIGSCLVSRFLVVWYACSNNTCDRLSVRICAKRHTTINPPTVMFTTLHAIMNKHSRYINLRSHKHANTAITT